MSLSSRNSTLRYLLKKNENKYKIHNMQKEMYMNVYKSYSHQQSNLETSPMLTNKQINRFLFIHIKPLKIEWTTHSPSWWTFSWAKAYRHKIPFTMWFNLLELLEQQAKIYGDRNQKLVALGAGNWL